MTRDDARRTIRSEWRLIIREITKGAKTKVNHEPSWICPLCGHGTHGDGLTVNPKSVDGNGLKCFGCDFSGDIIDLYSQVNSKDYNTSLKDLAQLIGISIDQNPGSVYQYKDQNRSAKMNESPSPKGNTEKKEETVITAADYTSYYEKCKKHLTNPEAMEYLQRRGVYDTAVYYGVGFDPMADPANAPGGNGEILHPCPRIIIPCSTGHYVARRIDNNSQYKALNPARAKGAAAPAIFNAKALDNPKAQELFVTEGVFDALSVMEVAGKDTAIALNSTSNAKALIEKLEQTSTTAVLIISLDNDAAGAKAIQTLQEGLQLLNIPYITADISKGHKDPNEAMIADYYAFKGSVQDALNKARAVSETMHQEAKEKMEDDKHTATSMIEDFLNTVMSRKYEPIPTGIAGIDNAIGGGFLRESLVLLGAAPGAGKTALTQWICENMARHGVPCLYLNLEMSRDQLLARSISRIAQQHGCTINAIDVLKGYQWTEEQMSAVMQALEEYNREIAPRMQYNPDGVNSNLDSILGYIEAEAKKAESAEQPVPAVILDYLQIVTGKEREDDVAVMKRAVSSLKKFAIKYHTFVYLIIAHNRESNKSGTVTMESGRDTSALEYSADLQLGLAYTKCLTRNGEKCKTKDMLTQDERQFITLVVTKGRFCASCAEVDLHFDGKTMSFSEVTGDDVCTAKRKAATNYRRV